MQCSSAVSRMANSALSHRPSITYLIDGRKAEKRRRGVGQQAGRMAYRVHVAYVVVVHMYCTCTEVVVL